MGGEGKRPANRTVQPSKKCQACQGKGVRDGVKCKAGCVNGLVYPQNI